MEQQLYVGGKDAALPFFLFWQIWTDTRVEKGGRGPRHLYWMLPVCRDDGIKAPSIDVIIINIGEKTDDERDTSILYTMA